MRRRSFLATTTTALSGVLIGCQTAAEPDAEIDAIKLENHRRDETHEFTVRIERAEETVFEETRRLQPAGSGDSTAFFEQPVANAGSYHVHVEVDGYTASPETDDLVARGETCLYLQFYLGATTLHWEHTGYDKCG